MTDRADPVEEAMRPRKRIIAYAASDFEGVRWLGGTSHGFGMNPDGSWYEYSYEYVPGKPPICHFDTRPDTTPPELTPVARALKETGK